MLSALETALIALLAYLLAVTLELPREAALGLVIMGTCPGGTTSNMFAYYARADVALSVSMTAASKLVSVVMMPLCLFLFARPFTHSAAFPNADLTIPYVELVKTLLVLLLPVALGIWLRKRRGERFAQRAEKVGSLAGVLVLVMLAAIALGVLGMVLGDLAARAAKLPRAQRRAVSFETGIQNSPLAFALIATSFDGPVQAELLKLPMLYAMFVLIEATLVTLYYRSRAAETELLSESVSKIEPSDSQPEQGASQSNNGRVVAQGLLVSRRKTPRLLQ